MDMQRRRNAFVARTVEYQRALADGEDVFAKFLNEDAGEGYDGALVYWFEQQPQPAFKEAAFHAVECCL